MKTALKSLSLSAGLLIAFCLAAEGAEVYRWVDENGKVHFSDKPKQGAETVEVDGPQKQSDSVSDQERLKKNAEWFAEQQQRREQELQQRKQQQAKSNSTKKVSACKGYRNKLADKQNELEVRKRAGLRVATENQLKAQIEVLERKIEREC